MRTIESSREIDELFKRGRKISHDTLTIIVGKTPKGRSPEGRVAFVAGKRIGGAIVRNRAKRLLREAARRAGGPWAGRDVALVARPSIEGKGANEVEAALLRALGKSNLDGDGP